MKIIGYLRTSSKNKDDHEDSIAEQKRKIEEWARQHGHEVVGWFTDEGVSGGNELDNRVGLPMALTALQGLRKENCGLAVARLDRLSRDMWLQEFLLREVGKLGAMFSTSPAEQAVLTDAEQDKEDPGRKLTRQILGAVFEYERKMTALRLDAGKRAKAARGGYVGGGVPFGQRVEDREFAADPAELVAIARVRELHGQGLSLRGIAATLNSAGMVPKRGGAWHASTVSRVLARAA